MIYTKITKEKSKVLRGWEDKEPYHTSVSVCTHDVYSICDGVVVEILTANNGYIVTIQYTVEKSFRYCRLNNIHIYLGQLVTEGSLIGECADYVDFEYITTQKSLWPVRVNSETYYKQDPTNYLTGKIQCLVSHEPINYNFSFDESVINVYGVTEDGKGDDE